MSMDFYGYRAALDILSDVETKMHDRLFEGDEKALGDLEKLLMLKYLIEECYDSEMLLEKVKSADEVEHEHEALMSRLEAEFGPVED